MHTVTFDYGYPGAATVERSVEDGATVSLPADPARDGYRFNGWLDADGRTFDADTPITGDITLTASWVRDEAAVTPGQAEPPSAPPDGVHDEVSGVLPGTGNPYPSAAPFALAAAGALMLAGGVLVRRGGRCAQRRGHAPR